MESLPKNLPIQCMVFVNRINNICDPLNKTKKVLNKVEETDEYVAGQNFIFRLFYFETSLFQPRSFWGR